MPRGFYTRSEKMKMFLRTLQCGRTPSIETRIKISHGLIGKRLGIKPSEEARRKMSLAAKGRIPWIIGKHHSEEAKDKIRKKALGRITTIETKIKLSNSLKGRLFTDEHKRKIANSSRGERNFNWKGGITPISRRIKRSLDYRIWKRKVLERDSKECQFCHNPKNNNLQVHHIIPFKDNKELRFNVDNGITLCKQCHEKTIKKESSFEVLCQWIVSLKNNSEVSA